MIPRRRREKASGSCGGVPSERMPAENPEIDRFRPRRDVSGVPPQGGYVAKFCPVRVQYDAFPPEGFVIVPPDDASEARMQRGRQFEVDVFAELERLHGDAVVRLDRSVHPEIAAREHATAAAMDQGVPLIAGGRLPADIEGRRVGEPDLLARAERRPDGAWAYLPIDVKHHLTVDAKVGSAVKVSALARPFWADAVARPDSALRTATNADMLQLAHYVRMLEACGHASAAAVGAIIGSDSVVTWIDLDIPRFKRRWGKERDSALAHYDFEFAFRLDVLAHAAGGASLVEPMWCRECEACPWHDKCQPELTARDSVSFLPRSTYQQWHALRRNELDTRAALAAVDERWVRLLADFRGDLAALTLGAAAVDPATPISELLPRAPKQRQILEAAGILCAADLADTPPWLADLASRKVTSLVSLWQDARVTAWGRGAPHLRPGIATVEVPCADVEIDIDMESGLDGGVYLWGALHDGNYLSFVSWDPDSAAAEEESFRRFWFWLRPLLEAAERGGSTVALYCWSEGAENRALKNGARRADATSPRPIFSTEVEALISSPAYVDLKRTFDDHLMTGSGTGLKRVAPLAGFTWRDEDPGGDPSMLWHATATDEATPAGEAERLRSRLLAYNEDDVRATAAIRAWMRSTDFPRFEDLKGPRAGRS